MYKVKFRSYECKICKTKYASSGSLWGHNKKFHSNENSHNIVTDISTNNSYSHDLVINDNNIENDSKNENDDENFLQQVKSWKLKELKFYCKKNGLTETGTKDILYEKIKKYIISKTKIK